jgi:hypothetical protein
MSMPAPPFQIGESVYVVEANAHGQIEVPCPICFGQLFVTLLLGNGTQEKVECEACGKGCEGPRGVVGAWAPWSKVVPSTVTALEFRGDEWRVGCGYHSSREIFRTEEEAEARRKVLHAENETYAERMFENNIRNKKKNHAWTVRYHRECIARLKQEMSYHEKKLCEKKGEAVTLRAALAPEGKEKA